MKGFNAITSLVVGAGVVTITPGFNALDAAIFVVNAIVIIKYFLKNFTVIYRRSPMTITLRFEHDKGKSPEGNSDA